MAAVMIEMDDGVRLRTWASDPVIPQRLPVEMMHGGPGIPGYLAPAGWGLGGGGAAGGRRGDRRVAGGRAVHPDGDGAAGDARRVGVSSSVYATVFSAAELSAGAVSGGIAALVGYGGAQWVCAALSGVGRSAWRPVSRCPGRYRPSRADEDGCGRWSCGPARAGTDPRAAGNDECANTHLLGGPDDDGAEQGTTRQPG
jgi:hypothetical protein